MALRMRWFCLLNRWGHIPVHSFFHSHIRSFSYQIPIIHIPELGDLSAAVACDKMKVTSQNDRVQLDKAKELTYLKGFYEGVSVNCNRRDKPLPTLEQGIDGVDWSSR